MKCHICNNEMGRYTSSGLFGSWQETEYICNKCNIKISFNGDKKTVESINKTRPPQYIQAICLTIMGIIFLLHELLWIVGTALIIINLLRLYKFGFFNLILSREKVKT